MMFASPRALIWAWTVFNDTPLIVAQAGEAEAPSGVIALVSALSNIRSELQTALSKTEEEISQRQPQHKGKTQLFSEKWLSILGISSGITGIVRDLIMNYVGRDAYHSRNGPLIDSMKLLPVIFDKTGDAKENYKKGAKILSDKVCKYGLDLFEGGGVLHTLLSELQELLETSDTIGYLLMLNLSNSQAVKVLVGLLDDPAHGARKTEGTKEEL